MEISTRNANSHTIDNTGVAMCHCLFEAGDSILNSVLVLLNLEVFAVNEVIFQWLQFAVNKMSLPCEC